MTYTENKFECPLCGCHEYKAIRQEADFVGIDIRPPLLYSCKNCSIAFADPEKFSNALNFNEELKELREALNKAKRVLNEGATHG